MADYESPRERVDLQMLNLAIVCNKLQLPIIPVYSFWGLLKYTLVAPSQNKERTMSIGVVTGPLIGS